MNHEEHDDLWRLLSKAKPVAVSTFFARNVLRELRQRRQENPGVFAGALRGWMLLAAGGCAAIIAALTFFPSAEKSDPVLLLAEEVTASPDYQVIGNLDELLDTQANLVWLENSGY